MAISATMKSHLAGSATYLAHLWRVEERPREIVVTWAAASIVNVVARGSFLRKNAGISGTQDAAQDAAARSIASFTGDFFVRMTSRSDGMLFFGLATSNTVAAASSINFAIRVETGGAIRIFESGTLVAAPTATRKAGDHLRVQRVGTTITYWLNRTKLYTSLVASSGALFCDTSLSQIGATVDEAVFGFVPTAILVTDHTRKITFNGEVYTPLPMLPTRHVKSAGLKPDNAELTHILSAGGVAEADILGGRWDYARFEFSAVNYLDLTMGVAQRMVGRFGEFKIDNGRFTAELRSLSQPLSQDIGDITGSLCVARQLGDFRCGQPMDNYTHDTTISSVTNSLTLVIGISQANAYFEYGLIRFRTGQNAFYEREIKNNVGNAITLQRPFPFLPLASDAVTVMAGCNRTFAKCKTFVNAASPSGFNEINFQGFKDMPGLSKLLRYPE